VLGYVEVQPDSSVIFFFSARVRIEPIHFSLHEILQKIVSPCTLQLHPLDTLISSLSILFLFSLSSLSHDFKRFVSKDSNITGFTISADWYKASRTYEISIAFTYSASIVRTSPFCGCWSCYHIDGEAKLQMDCYIIASTLEGGKGVYIYDIS
jgi:hypothetical protein